MVSLVTLILAAPLAPWSAPTGLDGQSPLRDVCVGAGVGLVAPRIAGFIPDDARLPLR